MKLFKFSVFIAAALGAAGLWFSSCGHNGTLSSITIAPVNTKMVRGTTLQYTATARFSDGTTIPWTLLIWRSSDTGIATISNAAGSVGLATALTTFGTTTITALDVANNISGTAALTVAVPDSITITPANPGMAGGTSYQFIALANFDVINGVPTTTQDITTASTWTTDNPNIARVSNTAGSIGVVTTLPTSTPTTVSITISRETDTGVFSTGTTTLIVRPTVLSAITVTSDTATVSVATGTTTQQFTAIGTFAATASQPSTTSYITPNVTWSSSNTAIATFESTTSPGLTTIASGVTSTVAITITAKDPITNISGSAKLTVTP